MNFCYKRCVLLRHLGENLDFRHLMRRLKMNKKNGKNLMWLVFMALAVMISVPAQDEDLLEEDASSSDIFNSEQIDVDGTFSRRESPAERLAKMRKKLEKKSEQMVQKKIEDIRVKQEKELAGKLRKAFRGNLQAVDQVSTTQAAPQAQAQAKPQPEVVALPTPVKIEVIAPPSPAKEEEETPENKVIPFAGIRQYSDSGNNIDFESNINMGLSLENMLSDNFSLGLGVSYSTMDITYKNTFNNFGYYYNNSLNGDEVYYTNLNLNLNGKVFLSAKTRIKPFIGFQFGYNRSSLEFETRQTYFNRVNSGNQTSTTVSGSHMTGTGLAGAEVDFSKNVGLVLDFRYSRALTDGYKEDNSVVTVGGFNNQSDLDKVALRNLGHRIEGADVASLNIGLVVRF